MMLITQSVAADLADIMWLATGDMVVDLSKTFSKKCFGNSFRNENS